MRDFLNLKDKFILITGASSGIGRETSIMLSSFGAKLVLTGRNSAELEHTYSQLTGEGHLMFVKDLIDETSIKDLAKVTPELDGLVHCAGVIRPFPLKFIGKKHIDEIFKINYEAPVLLTSSLLQNKKLKNNSSIVFLSSISSRFAHLGGALYSASKAGLNTYCRNITLEHSHQGIRANSILAAMVRTKIFEETEKTVSPEKMAEHEQLYPLGFGEPEDVANCVAFLLSEASKWMTGNEIVLDGGLSAGK